MAKEKTDELPFMKFFPADWLADCDVLSMSARGAWQTFLCKAWKARSASVTLKIAQWSRIFGATNAEQAERAITEIEECEIGDVIREDDGRVTLVSRRIERDLKSMGAKKKQRSSAARIASEKRWEAERMRKACESHEDRTADAMPKDAISEARSQNSESNSVSNDTNTPKPPRGPKMKAEADALEIYEAYPLKVGRAAALKAITKALQKEEKDFLLIKTDAFCKARTLPNGKIAEYTKQPATWFNQECYHDDQEAWNLSDTRSSSRTESRPATHTDANGVTHCGGRSGTIIMAEDAEIPELEGGLNL